MGNFHAVFDGGVWDDNVVEFFDTLAIIIKDGLIFHPLSLRVFLSGSYLVCSVACLGICRGCM